MKEQGLFVDTSRTPKKWGPPFDGTILGSFVPCSVSVDQRRVARGTHSVFVTPTEKVVKRLFPHIRTRESLIQKEKKFFLGMET